MSRLENGKLLSSRVGQARRDAATLLPRVGAVPCMSPAFAKLAVAYSDLVPANAPLELKVAAAIFERQWALKRANQEIERNLVDRAKDIIQRGMSQAQEALSEGIQKVKDVAHKIQGAAGSGAEAVRDAATSGVQAAKDVAHKIQGAAGSGAEAVRDAATSGVQAAKDVAHKIQGAAESGAEATRDFVKKKVVDPITQSAVDRSISDFIQRNPWLEYAAWGSGVGGGLGLIAGLASRRRRRHRAIHDALAGALLGGLGGGLLGSALELQGSPAPPSRTMPSLTDPVKLPKPDYLDPSNTVEAGAAKLEERAQDLVRMSTPGSTDSKARAGIPTTAAAALGGVGATEILAQQAAGIPAPKGISTPAAAALGGVGAAEILAQQAAGIPASRGMPDPTAAAALGGAGAAEVLAQLAANAAQATPGQFSDSVILTEPSPVQPTPGRFSTDVIPTSPSVPFGVAAVTGAAPVAGFWGGIPNPLQIARVDQKLRELRELPSSATEVERARALAELRQAIADAVPGAQIPPPELVEKAIAGESGAIWPPISTATAAGATAQLGARALAKIPADQAIYPNTLKALQTWQGDKLRQLETTAANQPQTVRMLTEDTNRALAPQRTAAQRELVQADHDYRYMQQNPAHYSKADLRQAKIRLDQAHETLDSLKPVSERDVAQMLRSGQRSPALNTAIAQGRPPSLWSPIPAREGIAMGTRALPPMLGGTMVSRVMIPNRILPQAILYQLLAHGAALANRNPWTAGTTPLINPSVAAADSVPGK